MPSSLLVLEMVCEGGFRARFRRATLGILPALLSFSISLNLFAKTRSDAISPDAESFRLPAAVIPGFPHHKVAEQSANSYDAGDAYWTPVGSRPLHRLAGALAIRLKDDIDESGALNRLTGQNGPLNGFSVRVKGGKGFLVLESGPEERARQLQTPSLRA